MIFYNKTVNNGNYFEVMHAKKPRKNLRGLKSLTGVLLLLLFQRGFEHPDAFFSDANQVAHQSRSTFITICKFHYLVEALQQVAVVFQNQFNSFFP